MVIAWVKRAVKLGRHGAAVDMQERFACVGGQMLRVTAWADHMKAVQGPALLPEFQGFL